MRQGLRIGWTFDERIDDGHSCTASLAIAQRLVEDPEGHLGPARTLGPPALSPPGGP